MNNKQLQAKLDKLEKYALKLGQLSEQIDKFARSIKGKKYEGIRSQIQDEADTINICASNLRYEMGELLEIEEEKEV